MTLRMDTGFASFILILSTILVVLILVCYCSFKARGWKKFAEEKLAMVQLQVRRLHAAEYTYDVSNGGETTVNEELLRAFLYLGIGCDAIYHPEKGDWSAEERRVVSGDGRISHEDIDEGRIRVITVRGTQDLEDILWDIDIQGISPGDDLVNESKDLSTRLISLFGNKIALTELGDKLTGILTSGVKGKQEKMQVSSGSWIATKNVLRHVLTIENYNPGSETMIITGHSLGGGAAFLATLVLSCLCDEDYPDIVCVSFGQPRVLVVPSSGVGVGAWDERKESLMNHLSTAISESKMEFHRILEETDPIPLIPTIFPSSLGGRGEKFLHVPEAIVINRNDSGEVSIIQKRSTATLNSTINPRSERMESILQGITTAVLFKSHKMQNYTELLSDYTHNVKVGAKSLYALLDSQQPENDFTCFTIPYDPPVSKRG